jgi:hypothetical protein
MIRSEQLSKRLRSMTHAHELDDGQFKLAVESARKNASDRILLLVGIALAVIASSGWANDKTLDSSVIPDDTKTRSEPRRAKDDVLAKILQLASGPIPRSSDLKKLFGLDFRGSTTANGRAPIGSQESSYTPGMSFTTVAITMVDRLDDSPFGLRRVPIVSTCLPIRDVIAAFEERAWERALLREPGSHTISQRLIHQRSFQCRNVTVVLTPPPLVATSDPFAGAEGACMTMIEIAYKHTC